MTKIVKKNEMGLAYCSSHLSALGLSLGNVATFVILSVLKSHKHCWSSDVRKEDLDTVEQSEMHFV